MMSVRWEMTEDSNFEEKGKEEILYSTSRDKDKSNMEKKKDENGNKFEIKIILLIVKLAFMVADQVLDVYTTVVYFKKDNMVFFGLCLVSTVLPALIINLYVVVRLNPDAWWKYPVYFLLAPFMIIMQNISEIMRKTSGDGAQEDAHITLTNMAVAEGMLEAVPQLFIQGTAWKLGFNQGDIWYFLYLKMGVSLVSASFALLTKFGAEISLTKQVMGCFPVALVLGSRILLCTCFFALAHPLWLTGFLPPVLGLLAVYLVHYIWEREIESPMNAFVKALLLPPVDCAGIGSSFVYCIGGLVFWLLHLAKPYSVLVFVLITILQILGGIGWKCVLRATNKQKRTYIILLKRRASSSRVESAS